MMQLLLPGQWQQVTVLLLIFIGLIVGAIFGGPTGAMIGAGVGIFLGMIGKSGKTDRQAEKPKSGSDLALGSAAAAPARVLAESRPSTRRKAEPLRWVNPNVPIDIQGRMIPGGMFYLQPAVTNIWEPSAISPGLKAAAAAAGPDAALPYWPAYTALTPGQRGNYLDWLVSGRRDANPAERNFGYLFLFFYGLERRVLVDGDYASEIGHEIANLVTIYARHGRSKSLPSYFCQLLHFWAHRQGETRYAELWPWILKLEHGVLDEDELGLILGNIANQGGTIPPTIAREIAYNEPEAIRSNVTTRSPVEFARLFDERFAAEFPQGLAAFPEDREISVKYRPASAGLRDAAASGKLSAKTKAAFIPAAQRSQLIELWNGCCESLLGYMRAKARSTGKAFDLATIAATPEELRHTETPKLAARLDEFLTTAAKDEAWHFSMAAPLFTFFGEAARDKYTLTQSRQLAEALSALGWLMEPDPRQHAAGFEGTQELVLFRGQAGSLSADFLGHCGIVQLAAFIAGSDGSFDLRENEVISLLVEGAAVGEHEKIRLRAWSALLSRNLDSAPSSVTKIAKAIPADKAQAVAQMLCRIASADGVVTKNEDKALHRIFKNLGLSAEMAAEFERYLAGFDEVQVSSAEQEDVGEAIPGTAKPKPVFTIDRERLKQLTAETTEVIHILSVAMADAEQSSVDPAYAAASATPLTAAVTAEIPEWCSGLNAIYVPFLLHLIERDSWSRSDFEMAARNHHLMSNSAYDSINEWSDETLGDYILTGDDPIQIERRLLLS